MVIRCFDLDGVKTGEYRYQKDKGVGDEGIESHTNMEINLRRKGVCTFSFM